MRIAVAIAGLALGGCRDAGDATFGLTAELSQVVPTVATLGWDLDGPAADGLWIEYGLDGALDQRVDVAPGLDQVPLLGLKPSRSYGVRMVARIGDEERSSQVVEVQTGALPNDFARFTVTSTGTSNAAQGLLLTSLLVAPSAAILVDGDGDVVWWYAPEGTPMAGRVALAPDGSGIYMGSINLDQDQDAPILKVSWDGTQVEYLDIPWRHHDFAVRSDGTIAALAFEPQIIDGETVPGERIVELAPDGTLTQVFDIWDHYDEAGESTLEGIDWPHANAIDALEDEDAYLVSFLAMGAVARVERSTGAMTWVLGGEDSDFVDSDGGTDFFGQQHQLHWLDDRLLVFVNGDGTASSSVVEVALDPQAGTAETLWRYTPDPGLINLILGDVHRFDDGHTLASFSYAGEVHEVDAEGTPVWTLTASVGGAIGYVTWLDAPLAGAAHGD